MRSRIRTMNAISRIRDHELQGKTAELAQMQDDLGRIREAKQGLRDARLEGCRVEAPEAMAYISNFLRQINREESRAEAAETRMVGMIGAKREEVLESWRGVRSVEKLRDSAVVQMNVIEQTAENSGNDERNLIAYGRLKKLSGG